jgi:uncharacterized protein
MEINGLIAFSAPYYHNKDIMHNLRHIELVFKAAEHIIQTGKYAINHDCILAAAYFHGFIATNENDIRKWLYDQGVSQVWADKTITAAYESHADAKPQTLEGTILHDAHLIEGGKAYMITKCLITGSIRGQTLLQTIEYIEKNILYKRKCYLPETIPIFEEVNQYTRDFLSALKNGIL